MDEQVVQGTGAGAVDEPDQGVTAASPDDAPVVDVEAAQQAQELLAEHVPLTLLVDLLTPTGESSAQIMAEEGVPEEQWWEGEDGTPPPADPAGA